MKIKVKLALQFGLIATAILTLFSLSVYFYSSYDRRNEFYSRLKDKALTTAKLFVDVREVDSALLKIIDRNTVNVLPREQVIIYDRNNKEVYRSNDEDRTSLSVDELNNIRDQNEVRFSEGSFQFDGILYQNQGYVVIASATDLYGLHELSNLKYILATGLLMAAIVSLITGWFFSLQALKPISKIILHVSTITGNNLKQHLNEGNGKDEISKLAVTFNRMLDRIENSFKTLNSFVANASHELRTPLTSITGQIEVALLKSRDSEEYRSILKSILEDIRNLNRLTNGLLEIAQLDADSSGVVLKNFRVDEMLWQARNDLMRLRPDYEIGINIKNFPTEENELMVFGIAPLFKTAITNLMENACKFSKGTMQVIFSYTKDKVRLDFVDRGIGIMPKDLEQIEEPFYRGANARKYSGQGLGLALARRIVRIHRGTMHIISEENKGTTVTLTFPCSGIRIPDPIFNLLLISN